jgi:hypothetical protein
MKAVANEVRSAWTLGLMPLAIMSSFHDRLRNRLVEKDITQAFPDDADVLYEALTACDFAVGIQQLHEANWDREDAKALPSPDRIHQRTQMIQGIWKRPFDALEAVFKRVGDTETLQEFANARDERAAMKEW